MLNRIKAAFVAAQRLKGVERDWQLFVVGR